MMASVDALTLAHDFINLAILLSTDELLVFVGELDLDPDLILCMLDPLDLRNDPERRFDGIIRSGNAESHLVE